MITGKQSFGGRANSFGSVDGFPREVHLPLARYRFRFKGSGAEHPQGYLGSAWRGAFGRALRNIVCVTHLDACSPCLLYRSCPYPYIFETPPAPGAQKMRKYTAAPHPFLLEAPAESEKADAHHVGLTLIGRGNAYLAYCIHAFERAGQQGLGRGRARLLLEGVWQAGTAEADAWELIYRPGETLNARPPGVPSVPPAPAWARLRFVTPLRLQRDGLLVRPEMFRFSDLFSALLRRISMLTYFHTEAQHETGFAELVKQAHQIECAVVDLSWKDWTRYSSRQKTTMQMGGLVGAVAAPLEGASPLWPYLWLGQWVHAGKGTSMGLGQYRIETASLPKMKSA